MGVVASGRQFRIVQKQQLYWAIQAHPLKDPTNQIPPGLWGNLTGGNFTHDPRRSLVPINVWVPLCNPIFGSLDELLKDLFAQLAGYQEYVLRPEDAQAGRALPLDPFTVKQVTYMSETDDPRMKADYLHEAFQRIIFSFIVANATNRFMQRKIRRTCRRSDETTGMPQARRGTGFFTETGGTAGSKRKTMEQEVMVGGEGTDEVEARKKQKKEPEGPITRAMALKYVARTISHHVGADIPTGTQIPTRRTDTHR
jgi:hypothetical protein